MPERDTEEEELRKESKDGRRSFNVLAVRKRGRPAPAFEPELNFLLRFLWKGLKGATKEPASSLEDSDSKRERAINNIPVAIRARERAKGE